MRDNTTPTSETTPTKAKNAALVLSLMTMGLALSACGGGGSSTSAANSSNASSVTRLAADIALPNSLSGGFAEGISADPDTGDLYVGTDNSAESSNLFGYILKAGSQQSSFANWALANTAATQGKMVAGTRIRSGMLYACVNFSAQVWALKLADKTVVAKLPLPGGAFCNDLAFDPAGNLFVTTNGPDHIYKLAAAQVPTANGSATTAAWTAWHSAPSDVGLNGLTYSTKLGKLVWAQGNTLQSATSTSATALAAAEVTLPTGWSIDGLQETSTGNFLAIAAKSGADSSEYLGAQLIDMSSTPKGKTTAVPDGANCATTVAIVGSDAFCTTELEKVVRLAGAGKL